jgi:hypothetical protein
MNWFYDLSIGRKLYYGFGAILLLSFNIAYFGFTNTQKLNTLWIPFLMSKFRVLKLSAILKHIKIGVITGERGLY